MSKYKLNPITGNLDFFGGTSGGEGSTLNAENAQVLQHLEYDEATRRLVSDKAIETTLNSLFLGSPCGVG